MLSRTASNLYWMSRNIERAENTARILDVTYRLSLLATEDPDLLNQEWFAPLNITGSLYPFTGRHSTVCAEEVMHFLALDDDNPTSICSCIRKARENARAVRGAVTSEMWEIINSSWLELTSIDEKSVLRSPSPWFDWVKERSHLFRGVTFGTMRRGDAFHFVQLGSFLERADATARILDVKYHVLLPSAEDIGGAVDYYQWAALLRSVSALSAYLMILRDDVPRSLAFCMGEAYATLDKVRNSDSTETLRRAGEMRAGLQFGRIRDIFKEGLHEYLTRFLARNSELGTHIEASFFGTASASPVAA